MSQQYGLRYVNVTAVCRNQRLNIDRCCCNLAHTRCQRLYSRPVFILVHIPLIWLDIDEGGDRLLTTMWHRFISSKNRHKHTIVDKENSASTTTHDKASYRLAAHAQQALSNAWRSTADAALHSAQHLGLVTNQVCWCLTTQNTNSHDLNRMTLQPKRHSTHSVATPPSSRRCPTPAKARTILAPHTSQQTTAHLMTPRRTNRPQRCRLTATLDRVVTHPASPLRFRAWM